MGFTEAVKSCYRDNYVGFNGRAPRSEYWFLVLANFLMGTTVGAVCALIGGKSALVLGMGLLFLAIFLPSLAAMVRRLHDTNSSGWWALLSFIPYLGGPIMLIWCCIPGTQGDNRFGPDPLQGDVAEAFS